MRGSVIAILFFAAIVADPVAAEPSPAAKPSRDEILEAARAMMTAIRYCTLVTLDASGRPNARILDPFPPEESMAVWMATTPKSRKVGEIRRDPRVTLVYFDPGKPEQGYVALTGRARLVDDPAEKKKRWKEGWEAFWPDRDASFLLIQVTPERVEILDPRHGIVNDAVTWAPTSVELPRKEVP